MDDDDDRTLPRSKAREFIRKQGLAIADHALSNMATAGKGPKYTYGKGGVRYTEEECWPMSKLRRRAEREDIRN